MPRRDTARRTQREAGERPTTSNPATSKNKKKQTRLDFDLFGGDEGEPCTTGSRAPAPCACPRAPCRDGRVERLSTKIGWPSRAVAGRALSCGVRDCENDARRCPRRASRGRTGCPRSCPRPWWWCGVTRAAVEEGVGGRARGSEDETSSPIVGGFGLVSGVGVERVLVIGKKIIIFFQQLVCCQSQQV